MTSGKSVEDRAYEEIRPYVKSYCPIIYIQTYEEDSAEKVIPRPFKDEGGVQTIREWSLATGWVDFYTKEAMEAKPTKELAAALLTYSSGDMLSSVRALVIKDAHHFLGDANVVATLKAMVMCISTRGIRTTIFIVSSRRNIPFELENFTSWFELKTPGKAEILHRLKEEGARAGYTLGDAKEIADLAENLRGLTNHQITQIVQRIANRNNRKIDSRGVSMILEEKRQIIRKSGILELASADAMGGQTSLGGFRTLKSWLAQKKEIFERLSEAEEFGVGKPKGILLVGMPGCGKSLCAKIIASELRIPLLRLDVGRLHGRYVGESEENMRRALKLAEDISPCVLWIDELEKAFSGANGGNNGSDVTTRLFGYFLSWLQEKTDPVFVVATANKLDPLPPELKRKGRFDESFFVDFPNEAERTDIFRIHLDKRRHGGDISDTALRALAKRTKGRSGNQDGYSGADLEAIINLAVERAFVNSQSRVAIDDLEWAIKETRSYAESFPEDVKALRRAFDEWHLRPVC